MKLNQLANRKTLAVAGLAAFLTAVGGGAAYAATAGNTVPATHVVYSQTTKLPAGTAGVPAGKVAYEKTVKLSSGTAAQPATPVQGLGVTASK